MGRMKTLKSKSDQTDKISKTDYKIISEWNMKSIFIFTFFSTSLPDMVLNFRFRCEYKKVLLCERKRHTARRVMSTHSVVLSWLTPPAGLTPHRTDPPPPDWPPPSWVSWVIPPPDWPPPPSWVGWVTTPPPDVNRLKTLPSPILRMRAVIRQFNVIVIACWKVSQVKPFILFVCFRPLTVLSDNCITRRINGLLQSAAQLSHGSLIPQ